MVKYIKDKKGIKGRIQQGRTAVQILTEIWWRKNISKHIKLRIHGNIDYGTEARRLNKTDNRRLEAVDTDALRKSARKTRLARFRNDIIRMETE